MAKITIINGPSRVEIENGDAETVGELLAMVREEGLLNVPADATAVLNGAAATDGTFVADGDELAFNKAVGQKGY